MTQPEQRLPPPIDHLQVLALMAEVVNEVGPNFRYFDGRSDTVGCRYVDVGDDGEAKPSCLVARILHRHGVPLTELRRWECTGAHRMHLREGGRRALATRPAASLLAEAQIRQDADQRYGEILDRVKSFARRQGLDIPLNEGGN